MNQKQYNPKDKAFFRKSKMAGKLDEAKFVDMNEHNNSEQLDHRTNILSDKGLKYVEGGSADLGDGKGRNQTTKGSNCSGTLGGVTRLVLRLFICLLCGILFGICFIKGRGECDLKHTTLFE